MTIAGCLILLLWLGLLPLAVGGLSMAVVDKKQHNIGFMWISGYMLLWAVFQVVCVGVLLVEELVTKNELKDSFCYVARIYGVIGMILAVAGALIVWFFGRKKRSRIALSKIENSKSKLEIIFWILFLILLTIQLLCSVFMSYADGDDAYYVAVSTITESSNTMYKIQPYSIGNTLLDKRHSLAPFPIWIAFLARISGCHPSFVAHIAVSSTLIFMTYVIYGQIGKLLFAKNMKHLPAFLCFTAILVIFGDYSIYTPENFMIARSRQGKAALGNIIIPVVVFLFLLIFERYKEDKKAEWIIWVLLGAAVTSACLCSTLGTFLMCLFLGLIGLCAGIVYRKWEPVWKTALCCSLASLYAVLYFVM